MALLTREGTPYAVRVIEQTTGQKFKAVVAARLKRGKSFREIADEFGTSHSTIWRNWQKVKGGRRAA